MLVNLARLNGVLAVALLFLISSVAASPQAKKRAADVDPSTLRTNAARMAAGFPPLAPRSFFKPTKVAARAAAAQASPTLVTGRVKVNKREPDGSIGHFLGYLSKSIDIIGSDAGSLKIDPTIISQHHLTVSFLHGPSSGNGLNVAVSGAHTSYPNLGFAYDGTSAPKLVKGKYNYLVATNPTSPGAAASAVGNSLKKQTGPLHNRTPANPFSESAIWSYNSATRRLSASWNNPGSETLSNTRIFFSTLTNTFYQGTESDGPHSILFHEVVFTVV